MWKVVIQGRTQRGAKSFEENVCFSLQYRNKNYKHKRRMQKWEKKRKREDFNYVSKGILNLIISNIDFWTVYVLEMD